LIGISFSRLGKLITDMALDRVKIHPPSDEESHEPRILSFEYSRTARRPARWIVRTGSRQRQLDSLFILDQQINLLGQRSEIGQDVRLIIEPLLFSDLLDPRTSQHPDRLHLPILLGDTFNRAVGMEIDHDYLARSDGHPDPPVILTHLFNMAENALLGISENEIVRGPVCVSPKLVRGV
jgi:hypothetical protein